MASNLEIELNKLEPKNGIFVVKQAISETLTDLKKEVEKQQKKQNEKSP